MRPLPFLLASVCGFAAQAAGPVITSESDIQVVAFSKDGGSIVGKCADDKLRTWDVHSGALRNTLALGPHEKLAALPSGTGRLTVALEDGSLAVRDLDSGKLARSFPAAPRASRRSAMSSDGLLLARGTRAPGNSRDEIMRLWDSSGKERFAVPSGIGGTSATAISPDARFLVAGSYDTDLRVWNTKNGELVRRIDELLVATFAMDFTPDGKFLVTGGVDRNLYFWDTTTWKLARKLSGQPEMISALAIAPGGRFIATGGFSEFAEATPVKVLLWDTATNAVVKTYDAPRIVQSLAFSPDGRTLAAACGKKSLQTWAVAAE